MSTLEARFTERVRVKLHKDEYTAQEAKEIAHVTDHQLRYWDRIRLVRPSVQGTGGRSGVRRLYAPKDVVRLCAIRDALADDWSLQRIQEWERLASTSELRARYRWPLSSPVPERVEYLERIMIPEVTR